MLLNLDWITGQGTHKAKERGRHFLAQIYILEYGVAQKLPLRVVIEEEWAAAASECERKASSRHSPTNLLALN